MGKKALCAHQVKPPWRCESFAGTLHRRNNRQRLPKSTLGTVRYLSASLVNKVAGKDAREHGSDKQDKEVEYPRGGRRVRRWLVRVARTFFVSCHWSLVICHWYFATGTNRMDSIPLGLY